MGEYTTEAISSDFTGQASKETLFMFEDYNQRIAIAAGFCMVFLVGLVGNTLVVLAIVLSRKLRSSTNWFIVNLACADLLTCLSLPFNVVAMLSKDGWPLPEWICTANSALTFVCLGSSIMTIAFIAYNRWYLLTQPKLNFQKLYTTRTICLMVAAAWIYPFNLVVVPHFAGLGRLGYSKQYKSCTQDTSIPTSDYYSLLAGVGMIIPVFIAIVVIYVRIYRFVSLHNKRMASHGMSTASVAVNNIKDNGSSLTMSSSDLASSEMSTGTISSSINHSQTGNEPIASSTGTEQPSAPEVKSTAETSLRACNLSIVSSSSLQIDRLNQSTDPGDTKNSNLEKEHSKSAKQSKMVNRAPYQLNRHHVTVTKRLAIIVGAFFLSLLPFGVSVTVPPSDPGIPWTGLLLSFNSCVNPIIYARTMPDFRRVMGCIVRCRFTSIPEPISCLRRRRR